jgi:hypothetical protein
VRQAITAGRGVRGGELVVKTASLPVLSIRSKEQDRQAQKGIHDEKAFKRNGQVSQ